MSRVTSDSIFFFKLFPPLLAVCKSHQPLRTLNTQHAVFSTAVEIAGRFSFPSGSSSMQCKHCLCSKMPPNDFIGDLQLQILAVVFQLEGHMLSLNIPTMPIFPLNITQLSIFKRPRRSPSGNAGFCTREKRICFCRTGEVFTRSGALDIHMEPIFPICYFQCDNCTPI